ncbi:MAG: FAD-dependent monooxygenase [Specibacter sp.]
MKARADIIGGGIAGLAAARALAMYGWDISVRERAAALPVTGTALGLWPEALAALKEIGAAPAVLEAATRVSVVGGTGLWTPRGHTLLATNGGEGLHMIPRPALLAALADGVDITFGAEGQGLGGAAAVVVGADGTHSRTRVDMFGESYRARSLGAVAWRGTVAGTVGQYGETWAPGAMFGITPAGPGLTNWYACITAAGEFLPPHLQHLRDIFGPWRSGPAEVLDMVREDSILHHELFETPRLPAYANGNTVLIGDAAHSMGPFLGRGACEALVDGATLGRCLAAAGSVPEGLEAYDRVRRAKTQRTVAFSRQMGRFAMMHRGFAVRNAALGAVGTVLRIRGAFRPVRRGGN